MLYPNPQIYHHLKTIFVHIPKTAGTSIENQLRQSDKDIVGGHTTALAFRRKYGEHFKEYFKFTVVRDPLERFASAFRYLREQAIHEALNNRIVHETDSIDRFVEKVAEVPGTFPNIVHMIPQHTFVCGENDSILVDHVCRFENLEEEWRGVCQRLGIALKNLPRRNVSRRPPDNHRYSEAVRSFVRATYARDFALFAYRLPD